MFRQYLTTLLVASVAQQALAQHIVRVEETWEVQVSQPDQQTDAPQFSTTMTPFGDESGVLLQIDFNHATHPSFSSGGIQIRHNMNEDCWAEKRLFPGERLAFDDEVIQWTQCVQRTQDGFYFGITSGTGQTWGSFGGNDARVFIPSGDIANLDQYDPTDSITNSRVTYAGNRVTALKLKSIRIVRDDGHITNVVIKPES